MGKKKTAINDIGQSALDLNRTIPTTPNFLSLINDPLIKEPLPSDFNPKEEAEHLTELWRNLKKFWDYRFDKFVHAGGSGMVFKVYRTDTNTFQALKIARKKLLISEKPSGELADSLSPLSERELRALEKLSHPNVVRLFEAISNEFGVLAIATTYVDDPKPLDTYLNDVLAQTPRDKDYAFSSLRLDGACSFLLKRSLEIAQAIEHMHQEGVFHFDVKPANVLISSNKTAMLTDLGACIHSTDFRENENIRVHFTWTYAHPDLTSMIHHPESISGGGLKASAELKNKDSLEKYDLFSFGMMLQESLAVLENEFRERSYSAYGFRYLHLIASLLLDGHNSPSALTDRIKIRDGRKFVSDNALNYPIALFEKHKIRTAKELVDRLRRYSKEYSWNELIPELDQWQPHFINTGACEPVPFTDRVANFLNHPVLRRLKAEAQLAWIREVYPGATHNRWSHTIGVFGALINYYNSLLSDPDVPTLRVLMDPVDMSHAIVAALLHDIGQVSFGHDLESACPNLYKHESIILRLLNEKDFSGESLKELIGREWKEVKIERVLNIINKSKTERPIDGVAQDIIDGPIDADKLDYLQRDSIACGVTYGRGIDTRRFLQALSVDAREQSGSCRLVLSYKIKGSAAIESLLLARYQMYGAVYWHHTFRCIQAMFSHAVSLTFGSLEHGRRKLRESFVTKEIIHEILYHWVVCGKTNNATKNALEGRTIPKDFYNEPPLCFEGERVLELVWKFANDGVRQLLERLGNRKLYKRVFEIKVSDLGEMGDYSALRGDLLSELRPKLAEKLERIFKDAIHKAMVQKGPRESATDSEARNRLIELKKNEMPYIIIDFPTRGLPEEKNFPTELGDSVRKYSGLRKSVGPKSQVFHVVRDLQAKKATLRVFAANEFHELIVRYLDLNDVESCVEEVIPRIKINE